MTMGRMRIAVEDMAREAAKARRRTEERERMSGLIRSIDAMVEELELLNLHDVTVVPESWRGRLALLFATLPLDYQPRLHPYPWAPTEVLDTLFDLQGELFELRSAGSSTESAESADLYAS
jgi:hypothetical protein